MTRKILTGLIACALLLGCVMLEKPVSLGRDRIAAYPSRALVKDTVETESDTSLHLYIAAVEYPEGYDWVRDTAHGTVDARMLLFKDGACILDLPAGDAAHISTDPDTHWLLEGHLYTTYSDGKKTWCKRDGEDLFCVNSAEDIIGVFLRDGNLWSLSQKMRGQGFALRYNGIALAENQQGTLIGGFYEDQGELCFSYSISVAAGSYTLHKYFLVADGKEKDVSIPSDATAVFDIRRIGGVTYATYTQKSIPTGPVLSTDTGSQSLGTRETRALYPSWCEIFPCCDEILIKGWYTYPDGSTKYVLWNRDGVYYNFPVRLVIQEIYTEKGKWNIAGVGYEKSSGNPYLIYLGKSNYPFSAIPGFRLAAKRAATLHDGRLYACLSGTEGTDLLWIDDAPTQLVINGPVTVVAYQ